MFSAFMSSSVRPDPGSFRMGRLSYCSCWLSAHDGGLYHRCRFLSSRALCVASARHTGHRAHCCRDRRTIHTESRSQNVHTGGCGNTSGANVITGRPCDLFIGQQTTVEGLASDSTEMTTTRGVFVFPTLNKRLTFLTECNKWHRQEIGFQRVQFRNSCSAI